MRFFFCAKIYKDVCTLKKIYNIILLKNTIERFWRMEAKSNKSLLNEIEALKEEINKLIASNENFSKENDLLFSENEKLMQKRYNLISEKEELIK